MVRRALFLDRDGVINVDHGYVFRTENFDWIDGIFDAARAAIAAGYVLVVVSNQSGIARGMFTETDFKALTAWMCDRFEREGAPISRVYHCPHHDDAVLPEYREDRLGWRKPKPGMLLQAKSDLDLDLGRSIMIGDHWTDAQAAQAAGVGRMIIVGEPKDARPRHVDPALRLPTVRAIADWLAANAMPAT